MFKFRNFKPEEIKLFSLVFFILLILPNLSYSYEPLDLSKNTLGEPGLITTPVAGPLHDGTLSFSNSVTSAYNRSSLSFQALPRVYGSFRYTGIGDEKKQYYSTSGYTYWDRSFDLRVDVLKEQKIIPAISVGLLDVIGGGIFSAEYIVSSKSFFDTFRITGGLGWGKLSKNKIYNTGVRDHSQGEGSGGLLRYKHLFRGDVGLFGGLEYKTPIDELKLKVEYSSDDTDRDSTFIRGTPTSDINYGLDYKINNSLSLSAYHMHGYETGFQINISASPLKDYAGDYLEPAPQPFYSFPNEIKDGSQDYWNNIKTDLEKENIALVSRIQEENKATVVIYNNHFSSQTQAIGRTLRIMSRHVPYKVDLFSVILSELGVPISEITIERHKIAEIVDSPNAEMMTSNLTLISSAPRTIPNAVINEELYPNFSFKVRPYYKLHLFDPTTPVYYDIGAKGILSIEPKPGINLTASGLYSVETTFDNIWRGEKGSLPHVRSSIKNYENEIRPRIETLTGASYSKLSKDIYSRITLGYLEQMYAGLSTEILYSPTEHDFSIGAELNYLKPRDYRQLYGFREIPRLKVDKDGFFKTAYISGYWDTGYYDYLAQLDYGKYLAGDIGQTITLSRNFSNGWKVGGFFTLTDVSFKQWGEGSFDKGIFFQIPLNPILPYETRSYIQDGFKPLMGDGGQRVNVQGRIYNLISDKSKSRLVKTWPKLWR